MTPVPGVFSSANLFEKTLIGTVANKTIPARSVQAGISLTGLSNATWSFSVLK